VPATVADARYRGTAWDLDLTIPGHTPGGSALATTTVHAVTPPTRKAAPGDLVRARMPAGHGHVIPDRPGEPGSPV
jgi:hypothetical protein